ncbi:MULTISPECIES: P1 family peptidase [unclassified Roseitalea]|uniref:P1 family peptidase n=1 Tax=unclassified Roseitalea TaxID=2639107 RepID=UPI00273F685B|nr:MULTISPECIES: P1 family peptidase [unclassified Roseitalea]
MPIEPGPRNLITDVPDLRVGQATHARIKSGVTAVICDVPTTAGVQVLGGAPGTRETDLLEPHNTVQTVDAVVLAGGSAFGLDAAAGVQDWLAEQGRGFPVGAHRVPIVPAAILFDLINGGDKDWGDKSPYRALGALAAQAADDHFSIGSHGAGAGATTAGLKGGLGSASAMLDDPQITVGALVAVNCLGSVTVGDTRHFWAAPFEIDGEFGGLGPAHPLPVNATEIAVKFRQMASDRALANTTIGVIATDARLTKAQCKRLAIAAHDGLARAIWPAHTPFDGDCIFALSTNRIDVEDDQDVFIDLCAAAASAMARAVARGVYAAHEEPSDLMPPWSARR